MQMKSHVQSSSADRQQSAVDASNSLMQLQKASKGGAAPCPSLPKRCFSHPFLFLRLCVCCLLVPRRSALCCGGAVSFAVLFCVAFSYYCVDGRCRLVLEIVCRAGYFCVVPSSMSWCVWSCCRLLYLS